MNLQRPSVVPGTQQSKESTAVWSELYRPFRKQSRLLFTLLLSTICLLSVVRNCLDALHLYMTDHRLMPLFLILHHYPLYIDPTTGPTMSSMYPPFSVLLYAPAALFHSVGGCFAAAGLVAQFLSLTPLVLGLILLRSRSNGSALRVLLVCALFMMWSNIAPVLGALRFVHADDPALFLAGCGILSFAAHREWHKPGLIVLSGVLCSLAPWAKQPAFPVVLVPAVLLLISRERRNFTIFVASAAATHLAVIAVWSRMFDLHWMFTWLFIIPAHQPWKDTRFGALVNANDMLITANLAALTILTTVLLWRKRRHIEEKRDVFRSLSSEPWFVFLLAGVALWPTSLLGYSKEGGVENALLYSTYFISLALAFWLYDALAARSPSLSVPVSIAFVFLLISTCGMFLQWSRTWEPSSISHVNSVQVYNFDRKWPGEVFFPWYPLSVYFAEGHVYNFDLGVCDRDLAGIKINESSYRSHLPPNMKYVAYRNEPSRCSLGLLPEYNVRVTDPRLPGWTLYAKQ